MGLRPLSLACIRELSTIQQSMQPPPTGVAFRRRRHAWDDSPPPLPSRGGKREFFLLLTIEMAQEDVLDARAHTSLARTPFCLAAGLVWNSSSPGTCLPLRGHPTTTLSFERAPHHHTFLPLRGLCLGSVLSLGFAKRTESTQ